MGAAESRQRSRRKGTDSDNAKASLQTPRCTQYANLYPEYEFQRIRAKGSNDYAHVQARPEGYFEELFHLCDLASQPATTAEIITAAKVDYDDPRAYWAAVGLPLNLGYDLRDLIDTVADRKDSRHDLPRSVALVAAAILDDVPFGP